MAGRGDGMIRLLDLFSGIGGFSLGLERTGGFKPVAFCEIEPFCRQVLKKHWPEVMQYDDIRTLTAKRLAADGISIDAICGGFPCQDISIAGDGAGLAGTRSGLWREYARLIAEIKPELVIIENVAALMGRGGDEVALDLASLGFQIWPIVVGAAHTGARHHRKRAFLLAYAGGARLPISECAGGGIEEETPAQRGESVAERAGWPNQSRMGRVAYGVPGRVDRIRSLGNAVCPQVAEAIGWAILRAEIAEADHAA